MAALAFLLLCFLSADAISLRPAGPLRRNIDETVPALVQQACKATRFPDLCSSSLSEIPPFGSSPKDVLDAAISVSASNLKKGQEMVQQVMDLTPLSLNRSISAFDCLQGLSHSAYRTQSAVDAIPRGKTKDARAWLSDAVGSQNGCSTGLIKYANDSSLVNETVSFLSYLTNLTTNALGMLVSYDLFGNETELWRPPSTERDGFWEPRADSGAGLEIKFGFPSHLKPNVIVCKDGPGGCYGKVQDAVDAAPDNGMGWFVIFIKAGVYEEIVRIPFEKRNVVFIGQGIGKTVITGNLSVSAGYSTFNTSTVGVSGDGFMATNITFQNSAGSDGKQAVAFRSDSDLTFIENCEFLGNQDTLYAHSLRQYYKSCRIVGTVDFIFGNAAAFFQDCNILVKPRHLKPEKGEKNVITAQSRIDPSQSTGFVFQNCLINGTEEYMQSYDPKLHQNFLGRPWREYARTVFINSNLESLITPAGWMPWDGDVGLKTLYYGEFNNSGPGSNTSKRVVWSSLIPAEHVDNYSVQRFIQGDEWIPIVYISG